MRFTIFAMAVLALVSSSLPGRPAPEEKKTMTVKKITPVLFAAEIEPCVKFWIERFGFEKTVEVPDGNKLGFAIVQKGGVELMYQSFSSADKDAPATTAQAVRDVYKRQRHNDDVSKLTLRRFSEDSHLRFNLRKISKSPALVRDSDSPGTCLLYTSRCV